MLGGVEGKCVNVVRIHRIANKTASCVCIQREEKEKGQVVGVPESLKALVANFAVGGCVHQ